MMKYRITESRLRVMIQEAVRRALNEETGKRDVYTISAFDIENEIDVSDMQYCGQTYYDLDDAIDAATEYARTLVDYGSVVMVSVYAGEYETASGDIYGEPQDVYTVSNSDRRATAMAREECGYICSDVDAYAV